MALHPEFPKSPYAERLPRKPRAVELMTPPEPKKKRPIGFVPWEK